MASAELPTPPLLLSREQVAGGFFTAEPPGKPLVLAHQGSSDNLCSQLGCTLHQSKATSIVVEK